MYKINVAIDGPAGSGKSTVAKIVAARLTYLYMDTGAMYRSLTLRALRQSISSEDESALDALLQKMEFSLEIIESGRVQMLLDGNPVEENGIRSHEVTAHVSEVSAHRKVRKEMVNRQRKLAAHKGVVLDGRDIGTHVLPEAELKIYMFASAAIRAERRHKENLMNGRESDIEDIRKDIERRDTQDMTREVAPLKRADDAIPIDTSASSIEEVVACVCRLAREKESEFQ